MIEKVTAVARTEAVSITVASGLAVRNGRKWREHRLKWLDALRGATGDAGALGDDAEDVIEAPRPTSRARITESQERLALLAPLDLPPPPEGSVDAAAVAREIGQSGARSIAIQARIGASSVGRLVDPVTR